MDWDDTSEERRGDVLRRASGHSRKCTGMVSQEERWDNIPQEHREDASIAGEEIASRKNIGTMSLRSRNNTGMISQ